MKQILIIFLLSFNLLAVNYYNHELNKEKTTDKTVDYKKDKDSFIFIPGYTYSSGSGYYLLGTFLYYDKKESSKFPNAFKAKIKYGSKQQFSFSLSTTRYFSNKNHQFSSSFTTGRYARTLYSPMGAKIVKEKSESYISSDNYLSISFRVKKYKGFYFGPNYTFSYYEIIEKEKGGILDNNEINGSENTIASGFGLTISKEKRENSYYPSYGYFLSFNNYLYPQFLGSSSLYDSISLSYKTFHKLHTSIIFAFQFYSRAVFGDVPFQKLSYLGGETILRGYSPYKYADKRFIGTQAELRFRLFWRLSATLFAGIAQVSDSFLNYFDYPWKYSTGFGFRFRLDPKDDINFRLDFAYNKDGDMYMYITTLEAF